MLVPWRAFSSIQMTLRSRSTAATDDFLTFMSATPDPSYSSVRNSSGCRRAATFEGWQSWLTTSSTWVFTCNVGLLVVQDEAKVATRPAASRDMKGATHVSGPVNVPCRNRAECEKEGRLTW